MTTETVIYYNPRCSKSRQTLALLRAGGVEPRVVLYLETPPSRQELERVLGLLGRRPAELIRFKDKAAAELGLTPGDGRDDGQWLDLLAEHPALMERPVVVRGGRAALGRPPEKVLALLD